MEKRRRLTDAEKLQIITDFMASGEDMKSFQTKNNLGHCTLSRWMTKFGITNQSFRMVISKKVDDAVNQKTARELALESKIKELEDALKHEQTKTLVLNTMIDVAEKGLGIDIRKKAGAKQ